MRWLGASLSVGAAMVATPYGVAGNLIPISQARFASATLDGVTERVDATDFGRFAAIARVENGAAYAEASQDTTIGESSIFGTMGGHITPGASSTMTACLIEFEMLVDGSFIVQANTPYAGGFVLYVWDAEGVTVFDRPFSSMDGDYFFEEVMPAGNYTLRVAAFTFGDGSGYLDVGGWFSLTLVPAPSALAIVPLLGAIASRRQRGGSSTSTSFSRTIRLA